MKDEKFNIVLPATLEKGKDGEWRVYGLASTSNKDQQGEIVDVRNLDLSPIKKGRGLLNFDHQKSPENIVGAIDTYKVEHDGGVDKLYLGGYLFKNHDRAKSLYQIMSSLNKSDAGRMGLSVEGIIKQRSGPDNKIISKAVIHSCALTMNPVNSETYVDLAKSLSACTEFETAGDALEDNITGEDSNNVSFSKAQVEAVAEIFAKTLGISNSYADKLPQARTQGDALAQEDLDSKTKLMGPNDEILRKKPAKKKLKKMSSKNMEKSLTDVLRELKGLYPDFSYSQIFEAVKDRLNSKFDIEYSD